MTYIIEGTISSITVIEEKSIFFTICGHEGYALKLAKKKYNVLLLKEIVENANSEKAESDNNFCKSSIVLSQDFQFSVKDENKALLIQSNSLGKKAQISFEIKTDKKLSDNFTVGDFETSSITLLAN